MPDEPAGTAATTATAAAAETAAAAATTAAEAARIAARVSEQAHADSQGMWQRLDTLTAKVDVIHDICLRIPAHEIELFTSNDQGHRSRIGALETQLKALSNGRVLSRNWMADVGSHVVSSLLVLVIAAIFASAWVGAMVKANVQEAWITRQQSAPLAR